MLHLSPRYPLDRRLGSASSCRLWGAPSRSEEHTSELQSLRHLVCRLLLEKSKTSGDPVRIVLAVAESSPSKTIEDLTAGDRPLRVSTEYMEITRRALEAVGVEAEISLSYGATEAKVPDIADAVVELTETGRALRAAGLRST